MAKYAASLLGERYGVSFEADSLDEFREVVLKGVKEYNKTGKEPDWGFFDDGEYEGPVSEFYVGELVEQFLDFESLADNLMERAQDQSDDYDPDDYGYQSFYPAPQKDIDDLSEALKKWFAEHDYKIVYSLIENEEKVEVGE